MDRRDEEIRQLLQSAPTYVLDRLRLEILRSEPYRRMRGEPYWIEASESWRLDRDLGWLMNYSGRIAPFILRAVEVPGTLVRQLVGDKELWRLHSSSLQQQSMIRFRFPSYVASETHARRGEVPLDHLAAASAASCELFVALAQANRSLGIELQLPQVRVRRGSVEFAVGGGLFGSGVGLLVACSGGLVAAPVVGPVAGAALASVGLFELALAWRQKVAETAKVREEARQLELQNAPEKIRQEHRMRELEIRKKELEIEELRLRSTDVPPTSSLVPREVVRQEAERHGFSEEYATHLINHGMPTLLQIKRYEMEISVRSIGPSRSDENNSEESR